LFSVSCGTLPAKGKANRQPNEQTDRRANSDKKRQIVRADTETNNMAQHSPYGESNGSGDAHPSRACPHLLKTLQKLQY
jgi:hypothetical protein